MKNVRCSYLSESYTKTKKKTNTNILIVSGYMGVSLYRAPPYSCCCCAGRGVELRSPGSGRKEKYVKSAVRALNSTGVSASTGSWRGGLVHQTCSLEGMLRQYVLAYKYRASGLDIHQFVSAAPHSRQ